MLTLKNLLAAARPMYQFLPKTQGDFNYLFLAFAMTSNVLVVDTGGYNGVIFVSTLLLVIQSKALSMRNVLSKKTFSSYNDQISK